MSCFWPFTVCTKTEKIKSNLSIPQTLFYRKQLTQNAYSLLMPSPSIVHIYLKPSFFSILNLTVIITFFLYIEFCFHSGLGKAFFIIILKQKCFGSKRALSSPFSGLFWIETCHLFIKIYTLTFSLFPLVVNFSSSGILNIHVFVFCLHSFLCSVDTSSFCFLILE